MTCSSFNVLLQVTPAKELAVAQAAGWHACLGMQFGYKGCGVVIEAGGEVLVFKFTVNANSVFRNEQVRTLRTSKAGCLSRFLGKGLRHDM